MYTFCFILLYFLILLLILLFNLYVCIRFVLNAFEMYNIALCLPCPIVKRREELESYPDEVMGYDKEL